MAKNFRRLIFSGVGFYIVILLIGIVAWEGQSYMYAAGEKELVDSQGGIAGESRDKCTAVQTQQIDAYLEINRLLTTLGTTLLGAVFFLLFSTGKTLAWKRRKGAAVLGTTFVAVSIFFGYVAYLFIISILQDGICDISASYPHWAQQTHFYTFLLGVVFFADFTYHNLTPGEKGAE
ncbi:MAG: hypothetical protein WAM91_08930 [Candidatus Acidiferrales bacterium]